MRGESAMLIFTSFGFRSPIVSEKLKGELETKGKSVLIVPFAGFNEINCAAREKAGLCEFGFEEENVFICQSKESIDCTYDYIYVPGGDTFKLLKAVREKGLMEPLRNMVEEGSIYIGVSAGAELATQNLEYVKFLEDNNYSIDNFDGLGLVEDIILPHYDQRGIFDKLCCASTGDVKRKIVGINNDGVVIYDSAGKDCDIRYI